VNCSAFVSAGSDFNLTVAAVCADPLETVASSYQTPALEPISLLLNLVAPSALDGGVNGDLAVDELSMQAPNNGQRSISDQRISEVGVFSITANAPAYFGQTVASGTSASIGRFFPHQFDLTLTPANFARSCNNFTYLDQEFFFNTAPQLRIEAKNAANPSQVTRNYEGSFWKLGADLLEQGMCSGISAVKGFCYSDNVSGAASLWAPNGSQSYGNISNTNGVLEMTLHALDAFRYQRPAFGDVLPFDADIQLTVELDDGDATGSQTLANIGFVGDSDAGGVNYNLINDQSVRHGRWNMENAFGPETQNLAIKAHAQYFASLGASVTRFILNPDDNCTAFSNADVTLSPAGAGATTFDAIPIGGGSSDFSLNSPLVLGEDENFRLTAPGASHVGDVDIDVNLNSHPWLKYDWNADGSLDDHPGIKATFGQYRGHDRIIYWREVSN
jgi:MSHA biogenesis protein MshQ